MTPPNAQTSTSHHSEGGDGLDLLRQRLQGATTDAERIHALFDLLEYSAATWQDALNALSYDAPTSSQASYYFHVLLGVPCEGGRSITDSAYWLGLLQNRGINVSDPLRRNSHISPSRG